MSQCNDCFDGNHCNGSNPKCGTHSDSTKRPAYLWDEEAKKAARTVGKMIRENESHSDSGGWEPSLAVLTDVYEREGLMGIQKLFATAKQEGVREGYKKGVESRQGEIDFLRQEAYGDTPLQK